MKNYLRFVTTSIDGESRCECGLFRRAYRFRDSQRVSAEDEKLLTDLLDWFNEHLPVPKRFRHISYSRGRSRAICWFKPDAQQSILIMAAMANLISLYGTRVKTVETRQPGAITYEDEQQIVAIPCAGTNLRGKPFDMNRFHMRPPAALLKT
jgi:hypothetical protein